MNVCIIGDGLTSLSLAKNLVNKKINVHIYQKDKIKNSPTNRTIGLAKNNLDYVEKEILSLPKKNIWQIKKIKIFSEKIDNDPMLNFEKNNNVLFCMVKNDEFYQLLKKNLSKNKFFKKKTIKGNNFFKNLINEKKYDLIINCDQNNFFAKKFFSNVIDKDYCNVAYTTILKHKKLNNRTAIQIFTKFGPIAFLPTSNTETAVVFSLDVKDHKYNDQEVIDLIKKYNPQFKIEKILRLNNFKLKSSNLRSYHYKNILAFGDSLHRIHPLAGQGFNMIIRDIKILSNIIQEKIDIGVQLDQIVLEEFEKKTRHKNFIFSNGIDFIYELFNFDKKNTDKNLSKIIKCFGSSKRLNNTLVTLADRGLGI
tara:strand:+ start:1712 stop:2809 length:1098 start_codon:yes stop_codon:yes gene_type:complete